MPRTNKRPGTGQAVRGAGASTAVCSTGTKHTVARGKAQTFAAWCATGAPHQLGLDPDGVARVCRVMSRPEMQGVTTLGGLSDALKFLRSFYDDDLSWQRFQLVARCMWLVHVGRVRPPNNMVASTKNSTEAARATTMADSIISRARARRRNTT
jgi:hypothetical protein